HPVKRVTTSKVLSSALSPSNQQLRFILLDCVWRILWLVISVGLTLILGVGFLSQIRSMRWNGPDLGPSNPIIALAALRQFWNRYGVFFIIAFGLLLVGLVILWIALEALCRGGWRKLWL